MQQSKNMNEAENKSPENPASPQPAMKFQPVRFVHEKGPQFRTYHADGAWGALNAQNEIYVNFFAEYPRLATGVINQVRSEEHTYTGKFQLLGDTDPDHFVVIRDFQCSVVLSIENAVRIRGLLDSFIQIA